MGWPRSNNPWAPPPKPAGQTAAQKAAAAAAAQARARAASQKAGLTYFDPGKAGSTQPANQKVTPYSVTPIVRGIQAWQAQNPNATDYWHAYAPGGNSEIGALMREDPQGYLAAYQAYNPLGGAVPESGYPPGYGGSGGGGGGG
ncbi:MAG TPA: hypothetical protein VMS92_02175, partial [Mycobacterium sp.]|nr:hypothetical protein [Mycobacterium sp.]